MHATFGERLHLVDRVAFSGIDHVRGPELTGEVQLGSHRVHGDDPACPGNGCAVDAGQAHPATADDGHGRARLHFSGVDDGAHAGGHPAADQRGAVERHVVADLHHRVLVDEHHLCERAQVGELL